MTYKTKGTCSSQIDFDLKDGKVYNVRFTGGCNGNLKGIGALVEGQDARDVINRHQLQRQGHLLPGSAGKSPERSAEPVIRRIYPVLCTYVTQCPCQKADITDRSLSDMPIF